MRIGTLLAFAFAAGDLLLCQSIVPAQSQTLRSEDGVNDAGWRRIRDDSGHVRAIVDERSIARGSGGTAEARVCLIKDGACPLGWRQVWFFDCRSRQYSPINLPGLPREMIQAKPGSVADKLAQIACLSS